MARAAGYFITTCRFKRKSTLASPEIAALLVAEWRGARSRHGWAIGRDVIMPNHVYFFCAPELNAKPLSAWRVRSGESCEQKWDYVREDPVR